MSNSSFRDTLNTVKGNTYKASAIERNYWNTATPETRSTLLETDMFASENAYQQENTAKFNELVNTNYDSLPESVKASVKEALIIQGELPNPSDYKGIGYEFIANPYSLNKEISIECDRCDEVFMSNEDFSTHKSIDHGDESLPFDEAEEQYTLSMNPDLTREALRESRKLLAEGSQKDLYRNSIFNSKQIKTPTLEEPKSDGIVGYNDDPNEGLYNTKKFKAGNSGDRVALEGFTVQVKDTGGAITWQQNYATKKEAEKARKWHEQDHGYAVTIQDEEYVNESIANEDDLDDIMSEKPLKDRKTKPMTAKQFRDSLKEGYEDDMVDYSDKDTLSDITNVKSEPESDPAKSLESIDFSEEAIDYVYPTKATESISEEKDPFLEGYGDDDIESDNEAVENQIIDRKLRGYGAEAIARELTMQYGVSPDEALRRVNGVEVSVNDKVANTFFGKRFNECTEAEINELRLYSGSDE